LLAKNLAKSGYFDCFCVLRTNHPGTLKFAGALSPWRRQKRAAGRKGIGSVVGDEVGELVGGVHALALLAATQIQAAALPAGVLAHPFDDQTAMVSAGEENTLCVTDGGIVYAWGSNLQGQTRSQ